MRECEKVEIRDLLPDHARGALAGAERARIEAHLASCDACRAELAVLRAVRAAHPAPPVSAADVSRIVGALPRPAAPVSVHDRDVVSLDAHRAARARGGSRRAALPWRRVAAAAAVIVGVVGVGVVGNRERGTFGPSRNSVAQVPVESTVHVTTPSGAGQVPVALPGALASVDTPRSTAANSPSHSINASARARTTDALGALGGVASDATDEELEALIGGLESLSGIPDVEVHEGATSDESGVRG